MGLDLKLLPFEYDRPQHNFYSSYTVLNCHRASELFDEIIVIEDLSGEPVPNGFSTQYSCYTAEMAWQDTTQTPYGDLLKCVHVRDLLPLANHECVTGDGWHRNKAAWAYLAVLPADTRVALYWN